MNRALIFLSLFVAAALPARAQQKEPPKIDDMKVASAIGKGITWLKERKADVGEGRECRLELLLLTLVHGGVKRSDDVFLELLNRMLAEPLNHTYRVALQAMVLEEVQRVKHQPRIHQCAQFLVDNQGPNGQWSYGEPTNYPQEVPKPKEEVASGGRVRNFGETETEKPKVTQRVPVKKNRDGKNGDNSNSQYAALGLRACHDSGILIPKEVVTLAQKWWREQQADPDKSEGAYAGAGWGYGGKGEKVWGSMTVGAVGSLAICDYILGENWKADAALRKGAEWIGAHFSVTENPKHENPSAWHYYYLYGLERAGMLYDTPKFGKIDWYAEGAKFLLDNQKPDGSWGDMNNTCFAILFLKRATRPLIATEAGGKK